MKVSKKLKVSNSQKEYQTHEKPKRPNWRARCTLAPTPGALKGGTLSHFSTSIVAKHQKNEGGPFGEKKFPEKILTLPKKTERGTLQSLPVRYVTRKNRKNLLVQFARPNDSIWDHKILYNF